MKMKRNATIVLYALLLSVLLNCSDENFKNRETSYIGSETKAFCEFKIGSWWVYRVSKTLAIDTWKLETYNKSTILANKNSQNNVEFIGMGISSNLHNTFNLEIRGNVLEFSTNQYNGLYQPSYFEASTNGLKTCDNNTLSRTETDSLNEKCILKTFKIEPFYCTNLFPIQTQWVRNVGIKTCIYSNGDSLELISCNVLQ